MLEKISTVLEFTKAFSLPTSALFWLIIFTYTTIVAGHILYGILSLICTLILQFSINILKNYFEYKFALNNLKKNNPETKDKKYKKLTYCYSRVSNMLVFAIIGTLIAGALCTFFYIKCGTSFAYIIYSGIILSLLDIFCNKIKYLELIPAIFYSILLFNATYYVMTKTYSSDVLLLSLPYLFLSASYIYICSINSYNDDLDNQINTIANSFNSQLDALVVLKFLFVLTYISPLFLCIFDIIDWQILCVWLTIPMTVKIYNSIKECSSEKNSDCKTQIIDTKKLIFIYSLISFIAIILGTN